LLARLSADSSWHAGLHHVNGKTFGNIAEHTNSPVVGTDLLISNAINCDDRQNGIAYVPKCTRN